VRSARYLDNAQAMELIIGIIEVIRLTVSG
jgi:hypothetical protein